MPSPCCARCECSENCSGGEVGEKRNTISAMIAGVLFSVGWWIMFDVMAKHPSSKDFRGIYYLPGFTNTLALVMVNLISNRYLRGDMYAGGKIGPCGSLFLLFLGFCLGFASLIASIWILFAGYIVPKEDRNLWYGFAIFLQNLLIFASGLIYKFGRSEENWGV